MIDSFTHDGKTYYHEYKFKIGDRLRLTQDYECGLDVTPIGSGGIVINMGLKSWPQGGWQMYVMKMDNGDTIGWSENLLELDDDKR